MKMPQLRLTGDERCGYPCELRWSLLTFHVYDFDSMSESGSPSGAFNKSSGAKSVVRVIDG